jgi:hypothetical protein
MIRPENRRFFAAENAPAKGISVVFGMISHYNTLNQEPWIKRHFDAHILGERGKVLSILEAAIKMRDDSTLSTRLSCTLS